MRRMTQGVAAILILATAQVVLPAGAIAAGGPARRLAQGNYRLQGYQWDQVLGQRWAIFEDTAHPERPLVSELDPEAEGRTGVAPAAFSNTLARPLKAAELVVHSGDEVTLWRQDANVWMQLVAVAEGNAAMGGRVELRVTGAGVYGNTGWRATGFVRGPGSVEME